MKLSTRVTVVAGVLLLGLTACVPPTSVPSASAPPTSTGPTPTAAPTASPSDPEDVEVSAAVVVMTASLLSVFGTDGSTLASVTYEMDGEDAVAQIAEALGDEPVERPIDGEVDGPCPPATGYGFGGLEIRSPGSLWSVGSYEVIVTGATTSSGVGIETVAGQQIGATRSAFLTAVGEYMVLYEDDNRLGFDVLNPEAHEWDRDGAYAEIAAGKVSYLAAPIRLGFIGGCS